MLVDRTVLLITHDTLEALRLGDQIYVMSGLPAQLGTPIQPAGKTPRDPAAPAVLELQGELLHRLTQAHHETMHDTHGMILIRGLIVVLGLMLLWQLIVIVFRFPPYILPKADSRIENLDGSSAIIIIANLAYINRNFIRIIVGCVGWHDRCFGDDLFSPGTVLDDANFNRQSGDTQHLPSHRY